MNIRKRYQFILASILIFSILSLFLQSCELSEKDEKEEKEAQPTFTLATLDPDICPQVTPIPSSSDSKPKLIYVLIDRSGSYSKFTKNAIDLIIDGLSLSIKPGDRLHLVWLGMNESSNRYLLSDTIPTITPLRIIEPAYTFTPTGVFTLTNTPTLSPTPNGTELPDLQKASQEKTVTALSGQLTVTANAVNIIATNTSIYVANSINKQQCDQAIINDQNIKKIAGFENQKKIVIEHFVSEKLAPLKELPPPTSDNSTHIYNALFFAARTIRDEKNTGVFGAYYLILLSDMEDMGSKNGESLVVDLSDVNVLMAMVYCKPSIACQIRENYWSNYFSNHGAKLPIYPFRLAEETNPYVISNFFQVTGGIQ